MIVKLRNRYYCEHCKKSGGQAGAMKRHESGCTKNPNRVCRMCAAGGNVQATMTELTESLRKDEAAHEVKICGWDIYDVCSEKVAIPCLREVSGGCPACILATIRQQPAFPMAQFVFDDEKKLWWDAVNDANYMGVGGGSDD